MRHARAVLGRAEVPGRWEVVAAIRTKLD
jgi:hypothetical protein